MQKDLECFLKDKKNEPRNIHALRNANPKEIKASVQKVVEVGYNV